MHRCPTVLTLSIQVEPLSWFRNLIVVDNEAKSLVLAGLKGLMKWSPAQLVHAVGKVSLKQQNLSDARRLIRVSPKVTKQKVKC